MKLFLLSCLKMSFIESVIGGFETEEVVASIDVLIKKCLCEPSQGLISEKWFKNLNTKNKLHVLELIIACYPYFDDEDCDKKTAHEIDKFMKDLAVMNDMTKYKTVYSDIKSIINAVRQCKDDEFMKGFIKCIHERLYWILYHSDLQMNLSFGVAELIQGHKVSTEMVGIIDEFLKNHPEYHEIILNGELGMHNYDNEYKHQSIKETERYLKNKSEESPDNEVYKMFYELFEIFVERKIEI